MATQSNDPAHGRRLLLFVAASLLIANFVPRVLFKLLGWGNPGSIAHLVHDAWTWHTWTDSWLPMMRSVDYFLQHPSQPIYYAPLYDTLIYSLASILPLWALKKLGMGDAAMLRFLAITSWMALVGIAAAALAMGHKYLKARDVRMNWQTILAVCAAVLFCYPLLKGYSLGNAQTYLSFEFAVLLLLWSQGQEAAGGVVVALLAYVKPQYVLLLIWMAVRRRWNATIAFLVTSAVLLLLSVLVFGWHNNLDFIHVLAGLSKKAQSHYGNQSMFGTLNRMIGNGENISYTPLLYTPYIPWVYRTTVVTSVLLMVSVLAFPWGKLRASAGDLAAMGIVSVAASPMAWEHHYGILCGVFAWIWFAYGCWQARRPWLLGVAAMFTLNAWLALNRTAPHLGWNIVQSYMYSGALLTVVLLMTIARKVTHGNPEPVL